MQTSTSMPEQQIYHKLPANKVNFILNDHTINANVAKPTTIAYHNISLKNYMKDKYEWTNQQFNKIWWKPHHKSMMKLESNDLIRIHKFILNYLPTNKRKNKYQNDHPDTCETCNQYIETGNHIVRCQLVKRYEIREKWIEELE
jgi:Leu/Phe-tRNA-protein transferase